MAQVIINLGVAANTQTGDTVRLAFDKVNQNFTEIYSTLNPGLIPDQTGNSGKVLSTNGDNLTWVSPNQARLVNGGHTVTLNSSGMLTAENITANNITNNILTTNQINASNTNGNFVLQKNGNFWSFDIAGNLTLPPGGLIKNSDGTQYAGGSSGNDVSILIDGGFPTSVFDGTQVIIDGGLV